MYNLISDPAPRDARLTLAFEEGFALPDDGQIAVFRPRAGESFAPLPADRLLMVQGFKPEHTILAATGYKTVIVAEGRFAAAMVCLPRAKAEARALIAEAMACTDGPVLIDGQKTDGSDSLLREMRARTEVSGVVSKAHGKLFWVIPGQDRFGDWAAKPMQVDADAGYTTAPGVFSADGVDRGSELLVSCLPQQLSGTIVDLGAGWGYLSAHILSQPNVKTLHVVEAEHAALECAKANITDPRAVFHWADATSFKAATLADTVIMNPPFHAGRKGQPSLGVAFIKSAASLLRPPGVLWMVSNRHLPYETALSEVFREVDEVAGNASFKVFRASHPKKITPAGAPARSGSRRRS
jgi:16S rRNA (guanine1207-N2)-methyltransferase